MKKIYFYKNDVLTNSLTSEEQDVLYEELNKINPDPSLVDCWCDRDNFYLPNQEDVLMTIDELEKRVEVINEAYRLTQDKN